MPTGLQLLSKARSSAAHKALDAPSAGQPSSSSLSFGRPPDLNLDHLDNRHIGAAPPGGSPAAAFSNIQTQASNPATIQPCYNIVFHNNQGPLDLGTITSVASAPSPAPQLAADGLLPTPSVHLPKPLPATDLRHRLDSRRPPNAGASSLQAFRSPLPHPTPPVTHTARRTTTAPQAVLRVAKPTASASSRMRIVRSLA